MKQMRRSIGSKPFSRRRPKKSGSAKPFERGTEKAKNDTAPKANGPTLDSVFPKPLSPYAPEVTGEVLEPETGLMPVYMACPVHPTYSFRHGGFCEKCYGDESSQRLMALDKTLDGKILTQMDAILDRVLAADTPVEVIERFLGRILARFARPTESRVTGTVRGLFLTAPVDFGRQREKE